MTPVVAMSPAACSSRPRSRSRRAAPGANQTITVNESNRYQQFTGGGASFTDTAAWLMNSSGALSQTTRDNTRCARFSTR